MVLFYIFYFIDFTFTATKNTSLYKVIISKFIPQNSNAFLYIVHSPSNKQK